MSRNLSGLPMGATLARIRRLAEERRDAFADVEQSDAEQARQALERRETRLRSAGPLDPAAVAAALAASSGRAPRVAGHAGSEAAAAAVEAFLGDPAARTLHLLGPTGRGQSHAATWTLAELAGVWLPATEVRVAGWDEHRAKAAPARLLVIDDLGREGSSWASRELADLLELRHNRGLRTITTSNLTDEQLRQTYGERCASRWSDPDLSRTVVVLGPDLRSRGAR